MRLPIPDKIFEDDTLIASILADMGEDFLAHVGIPHEGITPHSGRYPYGSGENSFQRDFSWYAEVQKLRRQGLTDDEIRNNQNMTTTQFRARIANSGQTIKKYYIAKCRELDEKGLNHVQIAKQTGLPESTVRNYLNPNAEASIKKTDYIVDKLREGVEQYRYIDVGVGIENHLGTTRDKLNKSIARLEDEGYKVIPIKERQVGTGEETTMKVLCEKDVEWKEVMNHKEEIGYLTNISGKKDLDIGPVTPPNPGKLRPRGDRLHRRGWIRKGRCHWTSSWCR